MRFIIFLLTLSQVGLSSMAMAAIDLVLPTENQHLFSGEPEKFYMYVDRYFDNEHTQPWEGGSYGYVRTSMRVGDQVIQTKFHEGIDIAPTLLGLVGIALVGYAIVCGWVCYLGIQSTEIVEKGSLLRFYGISCGVSLIGGLWLLRFGWRWACAWAWRVWQSTPPSCWR